MRSGRLSSDVYSLATIFEAYGNVSVIMDD